MICVSIGRTRHKMVHIEIQEAAKRGAELIELRLDFLSKAPDFKRLLSSKPCPMVVTVRRPSDGGRWSGDEPQRRMLLRQAIVAGFDWVDLETDLADEIPRFRTVKRIISYHNLHEVPADLEAIHERMCKQDPDVVKLAVRAQSSADNLRVLNLIQRGPKPTVAFCTGDLGTPSRILCGRLGAPFTYAAFNKERGIAPGILSFDEMKNVYHYDEITRETQVFGVVGDPVAHSLSPLVHNAAFRALGSNCVYVPFRIPKGEFKAALEAWKQVPVRGYSVTIPHKEAAAELAVEKDHDVDLTKAANTLIHQDNGFAAHNTDCRAAIESLQSILNDQPEPTHVSGRNVLLLGAGGAARAVAFALNQERAFITISNRTLKRAQELAEAVGCRFVDWNARHSGTPDTLINCTAVGMHPNIDESPVHPSILQPSVLVFDTVYTPETTLLVKEARIRGCRTLTGVDMFVRQAAAQFRLFTGKEPPLDLMRRVVRRALSPVKLDEE